MFCNDVFVVKIMGGVEIAPDCRIYFAVSTNNDLILSKISTVTVVLVYYIDTSDKVALNLILDASLSHQRCHYTP